MRGRAIHIRVIPVQCTRSTVLESTVHECMTGETVTCDQFYAMLKMTMVSPLDSTALSASTHCARQWPRLAVVTMMLLLLRSNSRAMFSPHSRPQYCIILAAQGAKVVPRWGGEKAQVTLAVQESSTMHRCDPQAACIYTSLSMSGEPCMPMA